MKFTTMLALAIFGFVGSLSARNSAVHLHGVITDVQDKRVTIETNDTEYEIAASPKDGFVLGASLDVRVDWPHVYTLDGKKESQFTIKREKVRQGKLSEEFPLEAHVIAVKMQTGETVSGDGGGSYTVWDSRTTSHQEYTPGSVSGSSYEWHLMMTVIADKLYGLSVPASGNWLHMGTYAFRPVRGGFQMRYNDEKTGRLLTQILTIRSEEPAPKQ